MTPLGRRHGTNAKYCTDSCRCVDCTGAHQQEVDRVADGRQGTADLLGRIDAAVLSSS